MASQETFYPELSPRSQKIIAKHKLHEMESNQWDYLMAKPNPEDHSHCIVCRATDLEWNYDIDRFSRNLWSHKKNSSRKTSPISTKSKDRKSPLNFNDSPTKTSPARRARSTSIGEKTDLSSSPIKRGVTFNMESESGQADNGYNGYYNIQEGHKSVVTISIPEKKVLDELYQIYANSQHNGNEHINIIENGQAFNPIQTPRKELFTKSPAKVVERNSTPNESQKWEYSNNNYFQTFSPFNVRQQESHRSNQEFDSRASLDAIKGEFKLQSEKSLSSQQTGRRSRNDRKKLKEEKVHAKIIETEPCDQQQESENWTSFKSFDKDDGSNEQTMVQREEKVKERRMRKDRLKKGDLNAEERKVDSYNNNLASREILPDKYSESNIEFETENFHNHSFSQKNDKRMSQVVPEYSGYLSRNQISEDNQGHNNIPGASRGSFSEYNIQKDFLSPFRGKGFAGYKLPINESRTFVDTERDICSTARKEELKGDNGSSHDKAMIKSSNRDSDSRKQIESLPLKRSEKFLKDVLPNEEEAEEMHDDAYERIMTRFLNQEPKTSSGSIKQASSANDEGQELENFMEIENQLMLKSTSQNDEAESQTTIKEEIKQPDQQDFDIKTTEKEANDEIQENKQDPENVEKEDEFENKYPEFEEILKKALPLAEALNKKEKKSSVDENDHIFAHPKEEFGKRNGSKDNLSLNNENEKGQMIVPPVEKRRKSKPTVFNTNITWEKLRLFRKVEQKAANKIQDFYSNKPKETAQLNQGNNQVKGISEDEFQSLIETMKKHEDLYHKMKQGLNSKGEKGEDLVNLSIAFISAYCSLKDN